MESTYFSIQWIPGIKLPKCEADQCQNKEWVELYLPSPEESLKEVR
jgi:hypothetical protein